MTFSPDGKELNPRVSTTSYIIMKLAMIGFGQAGGKIVDKFLEYDQVTNSGIVRSAIAVNTAEADLLGLEYIPPENQVLIGQARVKGHGVGADNELGAEIAEEDIDRTRSTTFRFTRSTRFSSSRGWEAAPVPAGHRCSRNISSASTRSRCTDSGYSPAVTRVASTR